MAAGLSIKRVHYPRFEKVFDAMVAEHLPAEALSPVIESDGELAVDEMTLEMAHQLAEAGPWGQQFPEPLFHDRFELVSQRVVGQDHLKLVLKTEGRVIDAIAFRQAPLAPECRRVRLAYKLEVNDYGQWPTVQLVVDYLEPVG